MTGAPGSNGEPWLPPGTPGDLRDFVAGRSSSVEIDTSELEWLPNHPDVPLFATPSVQIRPGSTPSSVGLLVTWGSSLPMRSDIGVALEGGALSVAANGLPPGMERDLDEWVDSFNGALRADERHLDSLRVTGSILIITSRSTSPQSHTSSTTPVPVAIAGLSALRRPTPPVRRWRDRTKASKLLLGTALVFLICGFAAMAGATWSYDPGGESQAPSATESPTTASATTSPPSVPPSSTTNPQPVPCEVDPSAENCALPPGSGSTSAPSSTPTTSRPSTSSSTSAPSSTFEIPCAGGIADDGSCVIADPPPPNPEPLEDPNGGGVRCVEPDVPVDDNGDGIADRCVDVYVDVLPPSVVLPGQGEVAAPGTLARTGSDGGIPIQLGVLLILAGLIALVAAHRRASDENPVITSKQRP